MKSMRDGLDRDARVWRIGGSLLLGFAAILYGFPIYWMISTSFKTPGESAVVTWWPQALVLDAYEAFFATEFLPAFLRSLQMSITTTTLTMSLALMAAYGLSRSRSKLVTPILLIVIVVQLIPPLVTFLPLFRLLGQLGLLNTLTGVSLAQTSVMMPFAILLLRPAFSGIPAEVEEAASIDGAGSLRYLIRIALPLVRNTALVISAIIFVAAWGDLIFPKTLIFTSDNAPLSSYIVLATSRFGGAQNSLMAVAALVALPVLLVVLFAQKYLKSGLTLGSVK